ncbi:hypothetical protein LTR36_009183 [Oleoguttula mirabilis]|uniref:Uncharacterized protein n=1 Tax=Oleoguttula mirabilis TaxID=1507867 RepID=A0AAV9J614_9PEZI|nr:hypothetical protein LTR36_009183 [Oleoguttula mirabilis]
MSVATGGASQPPPGGDGGDPGKRKPPSSKADSRKGHAKAPHHKGGNKMASQSRRWSDDEKQYGRNFLISKHDNGAFPTSSYTWQNFTDEVNAQFSQQSYTDKSGNQGLRGDRARDGIRQQFRAWWDANWRAFVGPMATGPLNQGSEQDSDDQAEKDLEEVGRNPDKYNSP